CEGRTLSGLVQTLSNTKQLLDNDLSPGGNSDCDFGNKIPLQCHSPLKLNTPAVLKAPKERKPSKKEGGTTGKASSLPAILYSCGICKKNQDQHLLVLCDTCKLYYHLGCLEPPLTRMPKKTKNSY
ncbi:PHD finger protein 14-like, partial [Notothenia coriiceps]|uniref:PHD finger protein 14-like n=1 Tax=Notothenia coriiceps TaxID=8208 RepID=A0A6I9PNH5_9TELE